MSILYQPSNSTEGEFFWAKFCDRCTKDSENHPCPILDNSFLDIDDPNYPKEWIAEDDGFSNPRCTAFEAKISLSPQVKEFPHGE